jgi:hypothetical protein
MGIRHPGVGVPVGTEGGATIVRVGSDGVVWKENREVTSPDGPSIRIPRVGYVATCGMS